MRRCETSGLGFIPDLIALQQGDRQLFPVLCESPAPAPRTGRYDILFAHDREAPDAVLRAGAEAAPGFLARLRRALHDAGPRLENAADLPFVGGYALFLSYEMGAVFEPTLDLPPPVMALPLALALRCPAAIIVDRELAQAYVISEPGATALHARLLAAVQRASIFSTVALPQFEVDMESTAQFAVHVERIQQYILAGDIFQANLSLGWQARADQSFDPLALYQRLRQRNPSPFASNLIAADFQVLSSSPERLVRVDARGRVDTRPIAGTSPRHDDAADADRIAALLADPKERAEHIMLIDLQRNDIGRVCLPGSVVVDELLTVESYPHVHHIVSNVCGQLRPELDALDAIAAVFPGGTITGCPKIRCMEILRECEGVGRGAFTGALGYIGRDGALDLNILIRTMTVIERDVWLRAGCGIVADSEPARELREAMAKAAGVLRALDPT